MVFSNELCSIFTAMSSRTLSDHVVPAAGPHVLRVSTSIRKAQAPRGADCSAVHGLEVAKIIKE